MAVLLASEIPHAPCKDVVEVKSEYKTDDRTRKRDNNGATDEGLDARKRDNNGATDEGLDVRKKDKNGITDEGLDARKRDNNGVTDEWLDATC